MSYRIIHVRNREHLFHYTLDAGDNIQGVIS